MDFFIVDKIHTTAIRLNEKKARSSYAIYYAGIVKCLVFKKNRQNWSVSVLLMLYSVFWQFVIPNGSYKRRKNINLDFELKFHHFFKSSLNHKFHQRIFVNRKSVVLNKQKTLTIWCYFWVLLCTSFGFFFPKKN